MLKSCFLWCLFGWLFLPWLQYLIIMTVFRWSITLSHLLLISNHEIIRSFYTFANVWHYCIFMKLKCFDVQWGVGRISWQTAVYPPTESFCAASPAAVSCQIQPTSTGFGLVSVWNYCDDKTSGSWAQALQLAVAHNSSKNHKLLFLRFCLVSFRGVSWYYFFGQNHGSLVSSLYAKLG